MNKAKLKAGSGGQRSLFRHGTDWAMSCPWSPEGLVCGEWCPHLQVHRPIDIGICGPSPRTYVIELTCGGREAIYELADEAEGAGE